MLAHMIKENTNETMANATKSMPKQKKNGCKQMNRKKKHTETS